MSRRTNNATRNRRTLPVYAARDEEVERLKGLIKVIESDLQSIQDDRLTMQEVWGVAMHAELAARQALEEKSSPTNKTLKEKDDDKLKN